MQEVFEFLDIDPKKSLRLIEKEISSRGKKVTITEMLVLRIVKAMVVERNLKIQEAKEEIFGVLDDMSKSNVTDRWVHDTIVRITS